MGRKITNILLALIASPIVILSAIIAAIYCWAADPTEPRGSLWYWSKMSASSAFEIIEGVYRD